MNLLNQYQNDLIIKREAYKKKINIHVITHQDGFMISYWKHEKYYLLSRWHTPFLCRNKDGFNNWNELIRRIVQYKGYKTGIVPLSMMIDGLRFMNKKDALIAVDLFVDLLILFRME